MQTDLQGAVSGFSTTVGASNIGVSSMSRPLSNDNMLGREVGGRVSKTSTILAQAWKEDTDLGNLKFRAVVDAALEAHLHCPQLYLYSTADKVVPYSTIPFLYCQKPNRYDLQLFPLALMTSSRLDIARSTWWP
ncbi:hypothetical protein GOBAR_AA07665 [Gossypium barbadense]|uniref:Uncharacterized protein n=1 Tax=Gossypium barbadense TaxID=3634 RepID=A0A2P5YBN8_GOSBA|nr:hypothetical protein GOBAR_AA07665 [Gossypium barbadense]